MERDLWDRLRFANVPQPGIRRLEVRMTSEVDRMEFGPRDSGELSLAKRVVVSKVLDGGPPDAEREVPRTDE